MQHPPGPARAPRPLSLRDDALALAAALALVVAAAAAGCVGGTIGPIPEVSPDGGGMIPIGVPGSGGSNGATGGNGLPCAVQALLQSRCQSCHSATPVGGAPMPLMTV